MPEVYLGLGSNVEDRRCHLAAALAALEERIHVVRVSSVYETEPVGFADQGPFLNMVCRAESTHSPDELLVATRSIEAELGRVPTFRNGPRVIDIDILFFGSLCLKSERLVIPHPALQDRLFVLTPLAEIAPELVHPLLGRTVRQLHEDCPDHHWVRVAHGGHDVPTVR